ncbi:MAG: hypothetical protein EXR11_00920 [Rhodospirillaceae bacterium]|nr:hypothetical protein [Rhodospirillaceae bacterium]
MVRLIITFIAGLVSWVVIATLLNYLLRFGLPGYATAEPSMDFSFAMQCARLALGVAASLGTGTIAARFAPAHTRLPLALGGTLLVLFLPVHYGLWDKFPAWYHLFFLVTIIPLVLAGARLTKPNKS